MKAINPEGHARRIRRKVEGADAAAGSEAHNVKNKHEDMPDPANGHEIQSKLPPAVVAPGKNDKSGKHQKPPPPKPVIKGSPAGSSKDHHGKSGMELAASSPE